MIRTTELLKTELGKAFLEAKQQNDRTNQFYKKNEIGDDVVVEWNPFKKLKQNPYAVVVANAYDEMVKNTIPQDAILSTSFQNWITRTKNELIVDSKIARDDYFKEQTNFETGEVFENRSNDLLKAKMDYLEKQLSYISKAFKTHMERNADKAFADEETLGKYKDYYAKQAQKVSERLERGDFSAYDVKDKEGKVLKAGSEEDAQKHKSNIDALLSEVENAQKEQSSRVGQESAAEQQDYVGDTLSKALRHKM